MKLGLGATLFLMTLVFTPAYAVDFPATPVNHGAPTNLPGEDIIPGLRLALVAVNGVTQPLLQPILAPGSVPAPAAAVAPRASRRHRHRFAHQAHGQHRPHRRLAHLHQTGRASHRAG